MKPRTDGTLRRSTSTRIRPLSSGAGTARRKPRPTCPRRRARNCSTRWLPSSGWRSPRASTTAGFKFHTGHGSRKARELPMNRPRGRFSSTGHVARPPSAGRTAGASGAPDGDVRTAPLGSAAWLGADLLSGLQDEAKVHGSWDELDALVREFQHSQFEGKLRSCCCCSGAGIVWSLRPGSSGSAARAASNDRLRRPPPRWGGDEITVPRPAGMYPPRATRP